MEAPDLATSAIFSDLDAETLAQLERSVSVATFQAGHIFFSPDDQGAQLYLLQHGRVRLYKLSSEGRALTLALLEPPEIFGELSAVGQIKHDSFAEAMSACSVGVIGREELRRTMSRHPQVALRLMELMARRLRLMENKLSDIAFKSVPQRLASVLLGLVGSVASEDGAAPAVLRYTHQQLAEMIGSYRETVTKAIGDFRDGGLIRVEGDTIFLTNVARLQSLAGR